MKDGVAPVEPVQDPHRTDILLPNPEELLNICCFLQYLSERVGKGPGHLETGDHLSGYGPQHPRARRYFIARGKSVGAPLNPTLLTIIKRKPKDIAEARQRPLGGVRLSRA